MVEYKVEHKKWNENLHSRYTHALKINYIKKKKQVKNNDIIFNLTNNHDCWNYLRKKSRLLKFFAEKSGSLILLAIAKVYIG